MGKAPHSNKKQSLPASRIDYATASYNFVSLPDHILPSELNSYREELLSGDEEERERAFRDFLQKKCHLSGHIDLELETLTPLFIGGNGELPFSPAGRVILPGSSIRGMVKNLLKIITCGRWKADEDLNDRHIFFRCLMASSNSAEWQKDLNALYNSRMTTQNSKVALQGFLLKNKKGKYFISPRIRSDRSGRILIREYEKTFNNGVYLQERGSSVAWHKDQAYIITGSQNDLVESMEEYNKLTPDQKKKKGKQFIRYFSLKDADWDPKHYIQVPEDVIEDYMEDTTRQGVNLLDNPWILSAQEARERGAVLEDDIVSVISCGYVKQHQEITAFGHGLSFRIPYKNRTVDAVPLALKEDIIDFATAIFGDKENWAGRVFFEDGEPERNVETIKTDMAHPLLQPKPTSYQLYLKQKDGEKLKHWDAKGAEIRGYKLYWHNTGVRWEATQSERSMTNVVRKITPINVGSKFHAKIRFENLTDIELGALLMVFDMAGKSKRTAYKIGQGKGIGLGSVKITSKLYIDEENHYTNLFTNGQFAESGKDIDGKLYRDDFKAYIDQNGLMRCWEETMGELADIMDWTNATHARNWPARVKSMSGDVKNDTVDPHFANRDILPTIHEVWKG